MAGTAFRLPPGTSCRWCGRRFPARQGCGVLAAWVVRCRRFGLAGRTLPRIPASVISSSSSAVSASRSPVSCPLCSVLVAHRLRLSAFFHPPLLVFGRLVRVDDRLGLQVPALAALSSPQRLARSAHAGHTVARVCPHGTRTCSTAPVPRSVRRSCTGRMQAPCSTARSLTTSGQRHGEPFGPGGFPGGGLGHQSPPSRSLQVRGSV